MNDKLDIYPYFDKQNENFWLKSLDTASLYHPIKIS